MRRLATFIALCAVLAAGVPAFGQAAVQRVEVQVAIDGPAPHPVIRERLLATVESVTDRLLAGRPLDQLTALGPRLGETIASVVERVVTGYAVASAEVQLGVVAAVTVRLRPLRPIIGALVIATDLRAVHPNVHALVDGMLMDRAASEIRALYLGLPSLATDWADPILSARAREAVEAALPGFTATVRVRVRGDAAQAELVVLPRDTRVVRFIGVRFRSSSIPTMLLDQHGPAVASMADPLRGLPVAFAQAARPELTRMINDALAAYEPARQYRIVATAALDVGETTYLTVVADSLLYRGRVEAQLNVGPRAPGAAIVGHVGRLITPSTEAFVELGLVPNTLSLEWTLGAQMDLAPGMAVGAAYAVIAQEATVWSTLRLGFDTGLRATWNLRTQALEGALIYRFNEFLSGELIATSRGDWWVRLISNL